MPAQRLFQITDTDIGTPIPNRFFSDKKLAKKVRSELNAEHGTTLRFVVSPGPDHHNYKGKSK